MRFFARAILTALLFVVLFWPIAATFDLMLWESKRSFPIVLMSDDASLKNAEDYYIGNVSTYNLSGNTVVQKHQYGIKEHDECTIFDLNNWFCEIGVKERFGFRDGKYFDTTDDENIRHVNEFEYHVLSCKREFFIHNATGIMPCLLHPYFY